MVVKCPSCGQQVRGEPGQSGPCPKCGQRFTFQKEDNLVQNVPKRKCPYCGSIQYGGEVCIKCGESMRQPLKIHMFGVVLLLFVVVLASMCIYIFIRDGEIFTEAILIPLPTIFFGGLGIWSIHSDFARAGTFIEGGALVKDERGQMQHYLFNEVNGLDGIKDGSVCTVYADIGRKRIIFEAGKQGERFLPFDQVIDIRIEEPTKEVHKSVIGRAAVGAAVAGPVGAIVGGMSGQGTKTVKGNAFFKIDYRRRNSPEVYTITLRDRGIAPEWFRDDLRVATGLDKAPSTKSTYTKGKSDYL